MKAPSHIAFGFVFTGLVGSLSDINILSSTTYIATTVLFSIIADIDHPRSLIGRCLYPISKLISTYYKHRTITHTVLALIIIIVATGIIQNLFFEDLAFSYIASIAFFSHLLLDMMTVQGVPLFYPFRKNSCVVPGNPAYRFNSNNNSHEALVFAGCFVLFVFMKPLVNSGFWTTYNQSFKGVKHLVSEYRSNDNLLFLEFDVKELSTYTRYSGYILFASESELALLVDDNVITLDIRDKVLKNIDFRTTDKRAKTDTHEFENISELEFLDGLYDYSAIVTLDMISDSLFVGISDSGSFSNNSISFQYPEILRFHSFPRSNLIRLKAIELY